MKGILAGSRPAGQRNRLARQPARHRRRGQPGRRHQRRPRASRVAAASGSRVYDGVGAILGRRRQRPLPAWTTRPRQRTPDPGLPVQAGLRGIAPAAQAGDRGRRQLQRRLPSPASSTPPGHVNCHAGYELVHRQPGRGPEPAPQALRPPVDGPRLGQGRRDRAFHRPATSATCWAGWAAPGGSGLTDQLPGRLERVRQWHATRRGSPAAAGPERARLPRGAARRGGLRRPGRLALRRRRHHPDPGHARRLRLPDRHRRARHPLRLAVVALRRHPAPDSPCGPASWAAMDAGAQPGCTGAVRPGHGPRRRPRLRGRPADRLPGVARPRRHAAGPAVREPRPGDGRPALVGQLPGQRDDLGHRPAHPVRCPAAAGQPARLEVHQLGQRIPAAQPGPDGPTSAWCAPGRRGTAWSTIIEATTATATQRAVFHVTGGITWPAGSCTCGPATSTPTAAARPSGSPASPPSARPVRPVHPGHPARLGLLPDHHQRPGPRHRVGPPGAVPAAPPDREPGQRSRAWVGRRRAGLPRRPARRLRAGPLPGPRRRRPDLHRAGGGGHARVLALRRVPRRRRVIPTPSSARPTGPTTGQHRRAPARRAAPPGSSAG